ncbi:hypothetical protein [Reyranella sp.]|uniref:hypothetical protein n=1 Tax=Reyranella sp. TaxID=1929291 RepID=UPI003F6FE7AF
MNRFFSNTRELAFDPPKAAFARLDQSEPIDLAEAKEAVLAFETVDANWLLDWVGFDRGEYSPKLHERWASYWQRLGGRRSPPSEDPYEKMPIYRFEITLDRGHSLFQEIQKNLFDPNWMFFELSPSGNLNADVFGSLFTPPIAARYKISRPPIKDTKALDLVFDMSTWPDANLEDIEGAIRSSVAADYLAVYDIGQGSANALLDQDRFPSLYFDLGCGVYRNAHTAPATVQYCWTQNPVVVLSHWDADHWAGANKDPQALQRTWVAPRQSIGPIHAGFANRILQAGGHILIWPSGSGPPVHLHTGSRTVELSRCLGNGRNGSGIAMIIEDNHVDRSWLLTGDAGYHELSMALPTNLSAVVVPHHGATMHQSSQPLSPAAGYRRLLYSFGAGNRHGSTGVQHPTTNAVNLHQAAGWAHGTWPTNQPPGGTLAGADVLATATHAPQHLGGSIVGWAAAPNISATPCGATLGAPAVCSISLDQS